MSHGFGLVKQGIEVPFIGLVVSGKSSPAAPTLTSNAACGQQPSDSDERWGARAASSGAGRTDGGACLRAMRRCGGGIVARLSPNLALGAVALGAVALVAACVFTPPPPLPEELAEQDAAAAAAAAANRPPGDPNDPAAGGGGAEVAFQDGDPPALGMTYEEMQAYAKSQGDPREGRFELEEALEGLEGEGALWVVFDLEAGQIECTLLESAAPRTVANFVGLARGLRPFKDPQGGGWVQRPYYDGTVFHRAIPGFMVQGGDPLGTGTGGPGYVIPDEVRPELSHDRAGKLSMANRGAGTGGGQFFVTLGPTLHLDGLHTLFGECTEPSIELAEGIAASAGPNDRPEPEAKIVRVTIERRPG